MITYNNSTTILFTFITCYFLMVGQLDYVLPLRLDLVDIYWCIIQFFYVILYSYLKRMEHFLIPVSVSKGVYRRKVEIVIFTAT